MRNLPSAKAVVMASPIPRPPPKSLAPLSQDNRGELDHTSDEDGLSLVVDVDHFALSLVAVKYVRS